MRTLNKGLRSPQSIKLDAGLRLRVVGQDKAIDHVVHLSQLFEAGLCDPTRPIGATLFLGPTGVGKTRIVEAVAEIIGGHRNMMLKVDCGQLQRDHEISKLTGSPPGYLGHRETAPMCTNAALGSCKSETHKFSVVLFDEFEKASRALQMLLLSVLDKGVMSLGDNRVK